MREGRESSIQKINMMVSGGNRDQGVLFSTGDDKGMDLGGRGGASDERWWVGDVVKS